MTPKRWLIRSKTPVEDWSRLAGFSGPVRQILQARGIVSEGAARAFFDPAEPGDAGNPSELRGMNDAIDRTRRAVENAEQIVVYGDYDADGVCASALLVIALQRLGGRISHYIPDRFVEGYGLNTEAVARIAEDGAGLLITVDCGIRAVEQVRAAAERGLDVIVTDHHYPGPKLPPATAIINPNQSDCNYEFKLLSGAGLAYKLACALYDVFERGEPDDLLDLVAIGTVADVTPLVGENRFLVQRGLAVINSAPRLGIRALVAKSGTQPGEVTATTIGFRLGPRINAAGRLGQTQVAYELLTTESDDRADALAEQLDRLNRERQALTRDVVRMAKGDALLTGPEAGIIVAVGPGFHEGVVGLAASKLTEEFYRPAIVAKREGGEVFGSCRSIPEFHITQALEGASELLSRFGGHAAAAGFRLNEAHLPDFISYLKQVAARLLDVESLGPILEIDAVVQLPELEDRVMGELDLFEPCGHGNPQPLFASRAVRVAAKRQVGADGSHLKLTVEQGGRFFDAIGFGLGGMGSNLASSADIAYHFARNNFGGIVTNQLQVVDIREPNSSDLVSR